MADEEVMLDSPTDLEIDEASRANTDTSVLLMMIVGVVGTALTGGVAKLFAGTKLDYFYQVIWERGPIQAFELIFGFMTVGHMIQKIRILRFQKKPLVTSPVDPTIDLGYDEEVTEMRQEMRRQKNYEDSILLTRIDRVLNQWLGSRDVGLVSSWSALEGDRVFGSSSQSHIIPQLLLTMIPMLGFIGTVLGLGQAVAGFSDFLSGTVALDQIKVALRDVTGSLGTAFDTTLLALVLSVIITIPLTAVIRRENELLTEFDTFLDDMVISRLPPPEPASIKIENLEDSIDAAFRRYIPDPDRYDEVFSRAIDKAADTVQEKFNHLTNTYEDALAEVTKRLAGSLGDVIGQVEASMSRVVEDVRSTDEAMVSSRQKIAQEETNRVNELLSDFQDRAGEVAAAYQSSAESLEKVTREGMDKSVGAATQLAVKLDEIRELSSHIDKMLHLQESVERSLDGLAVSEEFRKTLSDLRGHLATTDEFCAQMSKPRVITLTEELLGDDR
jgi:hypothetical protein